MGGLAITQDDRMRLQNLDRLEDWNERNKMPFSSEKWGLLYLGNKNAGHTYMMGIHGLEEPHQRKAWVWSLKTG